MSDITPRDQEKDPRWNMEPGLLMEPGTVAQLAPFEQFPSKYTAGSQPGNPYRYRPFPKMVYRAMRYPGTGQIRCMAAPPDPWAFDDPRKAEHAIEAAARFTEQCQLIVRDEQEYSRAMESGYRDSAAEAVAHVEAREDRIARETAERNYQDRNMSEGAKREIAEVMEAAGGEHQPEITGRKVAEAEDKRRRGRA